MISSGPGVKHVVIKRATRIARLPARINTPGTNTRLLQAYHHAPAGSVPARRCIYNIMITSMLNMITEGRQALK